MDTQWTQARHWNSRLMCLLEASFVFLATSSKAMGYEFAACSGVMVVVICRNLCSVHSATIISQIWVVSLIFFAKPNPWRAINQGTIYFCRVVLFPLFLNHSQGPSAVSTSTDCYNCTYPPRKCISACKWIRIWMENPGNANAELHDVRNL